MRITTRILPIINPGLNSKSDVKTIIFGIFLAIGKRRHKAQRVLLNIDHFNISAAPEANNQSLLFFPRVRIQLEHQKRNLDCFGGNV